MNRHNALSQNSPRLRVAIVEDEPLYRDLLHTSFEGSDDFAVVGTFGDAETATREIPRLAPDVVILDIELNGRMGGTFLGLALRRTLPTLGVVLLSHHRILSILTSIPPDQQAGWCYLLKETVQNVEALKRALRGAADGMVIVDPELANNAQASPDNELARLTPRQLQTLQLMAQGLTNQAIAEKLAVSVKSVENHSNQIYQALNIDPKDRSNQPRVQAVIKYLHLTKSF